jgi:hypothetical protein
MEKAIHTYCPCIIREATEYLNNPKTSTLNAVTD